MLCWYVKVLVKVGLLKRVRNNRTEEAYEESNYECTWSLKVVILLIFINVMLNWLLSLNIKWDLNWYHWSEQSMFKTISVILKNINHCLKVDKHPWNTSMRNIDEEHQWRISHHMLSISYLNKGHSSNIRCWNVIAINANIEL